MAGDDSVADQPGICPSQRAIRIANQIPSVFILLLYNLHPVSWRHIHAVPFLDAIRLIRL